jgi:hypothetical protein
LIKTYDVKPKSKAMEEKLLKEMIGLLKEIKESVAVSQMTTSRGPIADPGPDIYHGHHWPCHTPCPFPPLPVGGDPAISHLLPREELIKVRIKELEMVISQISQQVELLKVQKELLMKEYKIR